MKIHLKYICASFLILLSGMLSAQTMESFTLDVKYSVEMSESSEIKGDAVIIFQDTAYTMSGNGIESYCDGETVWTLDLVAKEVYIESITPDLKAYMKDLAKKLISMKDKSETSFLSPEGQEVRIRVISIKKSDGKDVSSFRPTQKFDSSWVVTDLR